MNEHTIIDVATIQAYKETEYRIKGDPPLTLKVGIINPLLVELYKAYQVSSCAWITAWNPFSQMISHSENSARNHLLSLEIQQLGFKFLSGIGQHPSGNWEGEPSYLVWGISLDTAKWLGIKHKQNAILWCGQEALPQLILLR
ncbi:MAG: DUF3293 domain-containing protein [Pseudomonadota bacterium]